MLVRAQVVSALYIIRAVVQMQNVLREPTEEKFRRLKIAGNAFKTKVGGVKGGEDYLAAAGWRRKVIDMEPFFVLEQGADLTCVRGVPCPRKQQICRQAPHSWPLQLRFCCNNTAGSLATRLRTFRTCRRQWRTSLRCTSFVFFCSLCPASLRGSCVPCCVAAIFKNGQSPRRPQLCCTKPL